MLEKLYKELQNPQRGSYLQIYVSTFNAAGPTPVTLRRKVHIVHFYSNCADLKRNLFEFHSLTL